MPKAAKIDGLGEDLSRADLIAMAKRIEIWPVDRLIPYEKNARTHSPEQIAQIAASIQEFGFTNPILVDSDDGILAGHGRLQASRDLGLEEVPVVVLDHLSAKQRRAYVLADNRLAESAGWDRALLQEEVIGLRLQDFNLDLLGFSDAELKGLLDPEGLDDLGPQVVGGGGGAGDDDGDDDDLEDGVGGSDGADPTEQANTQVVVGGYRIIVGREAYQAWVDEVREEVGYEKAEVEAEILRRLGFEAE